jgi:hypothetical protein
VTIRRLAARVLSGLGLACGVLLALASCILLHGVALVPVGAAAALAACVAYGARHESRAAGVAAAGKAAAGVVGLIMVVTGAGVVGGGVMVALAIGSALVGGGAVWLRQVIQGRSSQRHGQGSVVAGKGASAGAVRLAGLLDGSSPPVSLLPTIALGREWSRTSAALRSRLEPATRQAFVRRRQDVLDELERRDPVGFARWLRTAPDGDNDPADFVRGGRISGSDAA